MFLSVANNKIIGINAVSYSEQGIDYPITNIEVSDEVYNNFIADNDRYIYSDGAIIENPDYEEIKRQKEQERINNLTMTALDFINVVKSLGLSDVDIDEYLQANIPLKNQLTYCQNVYCGVVRNLVPLEGKGKTITDEMVVRAFKVKNGENPDVST